MSVGREIRTGSAYQHGRPRKDGLPRLYRQPSPEQAWSIRATCIEIAKRQASLDSVTISSEAVQLKEQIQFLEERLRSALQTWGLPTDIEL